jgi:hypothetical protein
MIKWMLHLFLDLFISSAFPIFFHLCFIQDKFFSHIFNFINAFSAVSIVLINTAHILSIISCYYTLPFLEVLLVYFWTGCHFLQLPVPCKYFKILKPTLFSLKHIQLSLLIIYV